MKTLHAILSVALPLTLPSPTLHAFTGNDLKDWCATGVERCGGYIAGVADAAGLLQNGLGGKIYCVPYKVEYGEVISGVKKFTSDHPEILHRDAQDVVLLALAAAFPCE